MDVLTVSTNSQYHVHHESAHHQGKSIKNNPKSTEGIIEKL